MTKEQEVFEKVNRIRIDFFDSKYKDVHTDDELEEKYEALGDVLNMLKEKDKLYHKALGDLVKADRENIQLKEQIDLMAEYISKIDIEEDICIKNKTNPDWCNEDYTNCKNCIKQYFERKSKE